MCQIVAPVFQGLSGFTLPWGHAPWGVSFSLRDAPHVTVLKKGLVFSQSSSLVFLATVAEAFHIAML